MNKSVLQCAGLSKVYHDGTSTIEVLKNVNLQVKPGDRIAIIGPSGSGKSTLLHLLGGLDRPTKGQITIHGIDWQSCSEKKRCQLRNRQLGFVYQFHHLLPEFSALENVAMPLLLGEETVHVAKEKSKKLLEQVDLVSRLTHKPAQLSGGERQRVAIARALVHEPACVLADEPTGNLDQTTAAKVFNLMLRLNSELNTALIIVTHDERLAQQMDKMYTIQNGTLDAV